MEWRKKISGIGTQLKSKISMITAKVRRDNKSYKTGLNEEQFHEQHDTKNVCNNVILGRGSDSDKRAGERYTTE